MSKELEDIRSLALGLGQAQNELIAKVEKFTGFPNKAVTPIQVVEIVRKVFGLEPKEGATSETPKA